MPIPSKLRMRSLLLALLTVITWLTVGVLSVEANRFGPPWQSRVTGASPGIGGDTSVWWSTTEGYVSLQSLRQATSDWAAGWTLPDASDAPDGWWGALKSQANVRAAPTTKAPIVGSLVPGDNVK